MSPVLPPPVRGYSFTASIPLITSLLSVSCRTFFKTFRNGGQKKLHAADSTSKSRFKIGISLSAIEGFEHVLAKRRRALVQRLLSAAHA